MFCIVVYKFNTVLYRLVNEICLFLNIENVWKMYILMFYVVGIPGGLDSAPNSICQTMQDKTNETHKSCPKIFVPI